MINREWSAPPSIERSSPPPTRRRARWLVRFTVVWLAAALIFWAWYLAAIEFIAQFLYPFLWLGLVGLPVWRWRWPLARRLQGWRLPGFLKFMLLGYMMVLLEEVFAALVNHLAEGFSWPLFLQRIGQFWAFNLLGFTGYFVGWYLLARLLWPVLRARDLSPARAAAAISPLRPAHDLHLWPDPGASGAQPL